MGNIFYYFSDGGFKDYKFCDAYFTEVVHTPMFVMNIIIDPKPFENLLGRIE